MSLRGGGGRWAPRGCTQKQAEREREREREGSRARESECVAQCNGRWAESGTHSPPRPARDPLPSSRRWRQRSLRAFPWDA
jgi:hypothetical protein